MSTGHDTAHSPFARLLTEPDERIDLARACLMIAEDAYPALDVEGYLGEIERLAARLRSRLAHDASVEDRIVALNEFLFADLGFSGNTRNYYDPRNSYLNEVVDRRTGIPITLAVLYMEIGRRIEVPLEGVSFPGHFMVRLRLRGGTLVLDPYSGGAPQSQSDLRARLKRVVPREMLGRNARGLSIDDLPLEQFLEPASRRQILARVLRNLKGVYRESGHAERELQVLNRMLVVAPDSAAELRDRGYVYERLECWRPALEDLSGYLEREPQAPDAGEVRVRLVALAQRCARLN